MCSLFPRELRLLKNGSEREDRPGTRSGGGGGSAAVNAFSYNNGAGEARERSERQQSGTRRTAALPRVVLQEKVSIAGGSLAQYKASGRRAAAAAVAVAAEARRCGLR